jgi:hypothetical protein
VVGSLAPALILLLAAGDPAAPLATLGATPIREADFQAHLAATRSPEEAAAIARDPAARREALEAYLDGVALAARGRQLGVDRAPRLLKARELAEQRLLAELAAEHHRERLRGAPVTEAELRREHALRGAALAPEPCFTARQLLVYVAGNPAFPERGRPEAEARARAEEALWRLRAGEGWSAVAGAWSDEPGARERGGLVRDASFDRVAPEVAQAARSQPLGRPGPVFRSALGYHVLQVEARVTGRTAPPFEQVRALLAERLAGERAARAREAFLAAARAEVGFRLREAGRRDAPLLGAGAVDPAAPLAEVDGEEVREADFRWFVEDAFLPGQRTAAGSRPGARRSLLAAYLDLRVLAAKARREGLHRGEPFARRRAAIEEGLLREFTEAQDGGGPPGQCSAGGPGRPAARRAYLDRLRTEVGLRVGPVEGPAPAAGVGAALR